MLGTKLLDPVITVCRRTFSCSTNTGAQIRHRKQTRSKKKQNGETRTAKTEWTDQHKRIISAVEEGKSVFITGSAGTGKTLLVKHIIKLLRKRYKPSEVYVTASTGVAACALKGQTLHSFSGIGPAKAGRDALLGNVLSNKGACRRWVRVRALVIDEISMVDGELFETLQYVAREIRNVDLVWGGIQLVVSGDFFQLSPILSKADSQGNKEFAFEADCWNSSFSLQVELQKVYRQSDPQLIKLLQGIRRGEYDPAGLKLLKQSCSSAVPDSSVVELYPRSSDVVKVNKEKLESLNKETFVFKAVDSGKEPWLRQLKQGIATDEIALCEGARVMLIKNLDIRHKLVNGATGTIVGFHDTKHAEGEGTSFDEDEAVKAVSQDRLIPIVKFDFGQTKLIRPETWVVEEGNRVVAERKQIPLILAWSISVHKCQGMTLDRLRTNLSKAFGFGMVYVALSRVQNLEGLYLSGLSSWKIKAHPKVLQFYKDLAMEQGQNGGQHNHTKRNEETGSKAIEASHRLSSEGTKFHFSLSAFLASRQK